MTILANSSILQMLVLFKLEYTTTKLSVSGYKGHEDNGQRQTEGVIGRDGHSRRKIPN